MKTPQTQKTFVNLSRETLALLADAQRRLLVMRSHSRVPLDQRSEENLKRIEHLLTDGDNVDAQARG